MGLVRKTSWSDGDLSKLCKAENHRIFFDGYEYWWQQNIKHTWTKQCIKSFDEHNQAYSILQYNLASWIKEDASRQNKRNKQQLRDIKKQAKVSIELSRIVSSDMQAKEKIVMVLELMPDAQHEDIASILQTSIRTVRRYIRQQTSKRD